MYSPVKLWRNQKNTEALLGRQGVIVSWTVIRVPPEGYGNQAPYPVVVVDIVGHTKITAQMVDWEECHCKVGQKVQVVLRKISEPTSDGVIPYGVKVKPL